MAEEEKPLLERLDHWLEQALFYIAAILLLLTSITVFYAVMLRYVLTSRRFGRKRRRASFSSG